MQKPECKKHEMLRIHIICRSRRNENQPEIELCLLPNNCLMCEDISKFRGSVQYLSKSFTRPLYTSSKSETQLVQNTRKQNNKTNRDVQCRSHAFNTKTLVCKNIVNKYDTTKIRLKQVTTTGQREIMQKIKLLVGGLECFCISLASDNSIFSAVPQATQV